MALSESEAVEKLQKLFPNRVIFADQYLKQTGVLSYEIHKIAKATGQTRAEWLADTGICLERNGICGARYALP